MRIRLLTLLGCIAALSLPACGVGNLFDDGEPPPLEGERISVLELQQSLEPDDPVLEAQGLIAPDEWMNEFWPQAGGYPNHSMQNLALNPGELKKIWSADIGDGESDELPLITQPVIVDGRAFTLDTESRLSAFNIENGKQLWRVKVNPKDEDDHVIAGGVASSGGYVFVTNGFNEVLAVNPADGGIIWRQKIPAASRAAPTVINDRIFVTTLDSRLLAMNAADGRVLWEYAGISDDASLVGAASPAANNDIVVPVFSSGEITALHSFPTRRSSDHRKSVV